MSCLPVIRSVLLTGLISLGLPASAADQDPGITWESCRICHGGTANAAVPQLEGRDAAELLEGLTRSQDGQTIMHRFTAGFSADELASLAQYISALKAPAP